MPRRSALPNETTLTAVMVYYHFPDGMEKSMGVAIDPDQVCRNLVCADMVGTFAEILRNTGGRVIHVDYRRVKIHEG